MTPDEFRAELQRLGLTQAAAATYLDVTDRTIRHWASGSKPIPAAVGHLLPRLAPKDVR